MCPVSDTEIHEIVQRVVERSMSMAQVTSNEGEEIPKVPDVQPNEQKLQESTSVADSIVAIGADHGGFELKEVLKRHLIKLGYEIVDCGTNDKTSVDYPDFAYAVAKMVSMGKAWRGIVIDGAGIGSCITANKVPGIKAALCYDLVTAVNSREHNNANVLTLGAGLIGDNLACQIVQTWLTTEFGGGRHARRTGKIDAIEQRYLRND